MLGVLIAVRILAIVIFLIVLTHELLSQTLRLNHDFVPAAADTACPQSISIMISSIFEVTIIRITSHYRYDYY